MAQAEAGAAAALQRAEVLQGQLAAAAAREQQQQQRLEVGPPPRGADVGFEAQHRASNLWVLQNVVGGAYVQRLAPGAGALGFRDHSCERELWCSGAFDCK